MMRVRDAAGRQVSLLNDDTYSRPASYSATSHYEMTRDVSPLSSNTPELLRSDSYDSHTSYDPASPLTPVVYDYSSHPSSYDDYLAEKSLGIKRPAVVDSRSNSYEEDSVNGSSVAERTGKRYPCRYRDSHGCEKTFTTSGHASRHSKIHTAEKAVQCTFPGCHKKFTRADNMKQHLETHYKDKSRSSVSAKSSKTTSSSKRGSVSSRSTSSQSSRTSRDVQMWDVEQYGMDSPQLASPGGAWDMRGLHVPLMSRPSAARTSSGLDALAAIACQEGV